MAKKFKPSGVGSSSDYVLEVISGCRVAARNLGGAMNVKANLSTDLRRESVTPPGSPLDDILTAFCQHTDMPLELATHSLFFYISTWLLENKTQIAIAGTVMTPELWTLILAESGSGKTYSVDRISSGAPTQATIEGVESGPAFFDALLSNEDAGKPNAMLVDEVWQMIKQMEQPNSPLESLKKYLLLGYGGKELTRQTKKDGKRVIQNSTMNFLGLNVMAPMINGMHMDSFLDGFCQRFAFVLARRDSRRKTRSFPRYDNGAIETVVKHAWDRLTVHEPLPLYSYTPQAIAFFDAKFAELADSVEADDVVNVSFFRRLMHRTHKLAMIYHCLLGKMDSPDIDHIDVNWAIRMTTQHLHDTSEIILLKTGTMQPAKPGEKKAISAGDALLKIGALKASGKVINPRTIAQNVRAAKDGKMDAAKLAAAFANMTSQAPQEESEEEPEE